MCTRSPLELPEVSGDCPEGKLPAIYGSAKEREPRGGGHGPSKAQLNVYGKKAVEEGPQQKTVGVVLGGVAMESIYY